MALKLSLRWWSATAQGDGRAAKAQKAKEEQQLPSQHLRPLPIALHSLSADLKRVPSYLSERLRVFKQKIMQIVGQ